MDDLPTRWEVELEFVQSLANIQYLTYLAQTGHLEDEKFLNYLKYLEYWRKPEYAKQLVYPNCLHILTLLRSPKFRKEIAKTDMSSIVYNDMVERWKEPLSNASNNNSKIQQNGTSASVEENKEESASARGSNVAGSPDVGVQSDEKAGLVLGEGNGSATSHNTSPTGAQVAASADTSAMDISA